MATRCKYYLQSKEAGLPLPDREVAVSVSEPPMIGEKLIIVEYTSWSKRPERLRVRVLKYVRRLEQHHPRSDTHTMHIEVYCELLERIREVDEP